jgi:hypothetical protein
MRTCRERERGEGKMISWIVKVITIILPEWMNQSSWNFVCTSCHLKPSHQCTSQINSISNSNTAASWIVLLTSLCLHIKVSFLLAISNTKTTVKGK